MTTISLTFQGGNWIEVSDQMRLALNDIVPAKTSFPEYEDGANPGEPEPEPAPSTVMSAPTTNFAPRSHKRRAATPTPEPAPPPEPAKPEPKPARDLPSIDVLKAVVTQAVRLAQKKEGPTKILDLLPGFKTKTGLGFVMEADDKHKDALADLIEAAGLELA